MIVNGDLPPGTKMVVRPLSEQLGLSATPIKSALAALERDGFIEAVPRRGFFVPEIGLGDMLEIYELREMLDGIAGRKVARLNDPAEFVRTVLQPLFDRQRECSEAGDLPGLRDLDMQFHRAVWHASGNGRLAQVTDNLGGQIRLAWARWPAGGIRRALDEHQAIMDAIAAGDADCAERVSRAHVRHSVRAFEEAVGAPATPKGELRRR